MEPLPGDDQPVAAYAPSGAVRAGSMISVEAVVTRIGSRPGRSWLGNSLRCRRSPTRLPHQPGVCSNGYHWAHGFRAECCRRDGSCRS